MATFKAVVFGNQEKSDHTWHVRIRVTHKGKPKYISTEHYVTRRQLNKDFEIKDQELLHIISRTIKGYRDKCDRLSNTINDYDCTQLREYLIKEKITNVDFIKWSSDFANGIKVKGSRDNAWIVLRSFIDFVGPSIDINEISLITLKKYEEYLRTTRKISRILNVGHTASTLILKPVSDTGVRDYMGKLKYWYNEAMKHYNDRGNIVVPYNPFDKYEAPAPVATPDKNLSIERLIEFKNCGKVEVGKYKRISRTEMARDVAMLSFYLVGMNAVDLYQVNSFEDGRISYDRAKTASRRIDNAYISIKVEAETLPLIEKYRDPTGERVFNFHLLYTHHDGLTHALNSGLKDIAEYLNWNIDLSFIWLRHSWGTIARNDCKVPKDDIAEAMNHSDNEHRVTDIYLAKSWVIIDEANRMVLDKLTEVENEIRVRTSVTI